MSIKAGFFNFAAFWGARLDNPVDQYSFEIISIWISHIGIAEWRN